MAYRVTFRDSGGFNLGPIGFLIIANLLFFMVTFMLPDLKFLLGFHPSIMDIRPWTIITNIFVHADIWHIFTNMIALYFFGSYVIRLVGERNFLIVYFIGGLLGNIFYWLILTPPYVAVGASGAIFALGGALTMMRPKLTVFVIPIPVPLPLWVVVIGGFLILSFAPSVAWQAHLGGLVFGLIMGYFFKKRQRQFYWT
ncbi:rhomboid family intramembrane serine protease [Chloroflexota bacterium]